jgi:hypothetical protein
VFHLFNTPKLIYKVFGAIAQLGERRPCKAEVIGSIPISSTKKDEIFFKKISSLIELFFERLEE